MRAFFLILSLSTFAYAESYRFCEFAAPPEDLPVERLNHTRNDLVTLFTPYHSANDVITLFGKDAVLEGKFSYGIAGKDLVDEVVEIWIDDCRGQYTVIHRAVTDSDGRIAWNMPTKLVKEPGEYKIWLRVVGDNSGAFMTLRAVERDSKIAVFDIDGTLTTREDEVRLEVVSELLGGNYSPPKREYSSQLVNYLRDRLGYHIVYLTGRHYFLTDLTKTWLDRNDFASGTLILAQSFGDIFSTNGSVGSYKLRQLIKLKMNGLIIDRAYGNALTDVYAYQAANIRADRTYILGKYSDLEGVVGLGGDFLAHFDAISSGGNV